MTRSTAAESILTLFFVLSFFSIGEAAFEAHVNYPAWLHISDQSFAPYHGAITARVGFFIVPLALSTVLNVLLLRWRPAAIPLWAVWTTLALQIVAWLSAWLVQIPIQTQLGAAGYSRHLLERLIWTDLMYLKVPSYIRLVMTAWMLHRVVSAGRVGAVDMTMSPARARVA